MYSLPFWAKVQSEIAVGLHARTQDPAVVLGFDEAFIRMRAGGWTNENGTKNVGVCLFFLIKEASKSNNVWLTSE